MGGGREHERMIEHLTHMGQVLRESLVASGLRIVNSTPLPLVCFTRDGLVPSELLAALRERQIAWMSEAQLGGVPVIRACITSFRTTKADIEWVVGEMNSIVSQATLQKDDMTGVSIEQSHTVIERRTGL